LSLADRMMTLNLGDKEPKFDNICVVCNTPCRDDEFTMATSERYSPATFVTLPGEQFRVPAHTHSKKCARKLRIHWLITCYGPATLLALGLAIAGIVVAIQGSWWAHKNGDFLMAIWLAAMILSIIAIVVYSNKFYYLQIQGRAYRDRRYDFTFKDNQYAASFRHLNAEFLERG